MVIGRKSTEKTSVSCRLVIVPVNEDHVTVRKGEIHEFRCEDLLVDDDVSSSKDDTVSLLLSFAKRLIRHYIQTFVEDDFSLGFDVSVSVCINEITTSRLHLDIAFGLAFCAFLDKVFEANESSTQRMGRCHRIWKRCEFDKTNGDFMTFVGISKLASNCAIRMFPYSDKKGTRRFDVRAVPLQRDAAILLANRNDLRCDKRVLEQVNRSYVRACKILRNSSQVFSDTAFEDLNAIQLDQLERHATSSSDKFDLRCARIVARERDRIRRCVLALCETRDLVSLGPIMLESSIDMLETCKLVMSTLTSTSEDYVVVGKDSSVSSGDDSSDLIENLQDHVHGIRMSCFDGSLLCLRRGDKSDVTNVVKDISSSASFVLVTRLSMSGLKIVEEDEDHSEHRVFQSSYVRLAAFSVVLACWIGGLAYVLQLPPKRRVMGSRAEFYRSRMMR